MPASPLSEQQISQVKNESLAQINPIISSARSIAISDQATYSAADTFLRQIRTAKRTIEDRLRPIIDPIRKGLDELYALKRELDSPLDAAEAEVKSKMKTYQLAEAKRAREEAEKKAAEEQRRLREQQEIEARRAAAERAAIEAEVRANATKNAEIRAQAQREADEIRRAQTEMIHAQEKARQEAELVKATTSLPPTPTRADFSKTRKIRRWRVISMPEFICAVAVGDVPETMLQINQVAVGEMFRAAPDLVAGWPGIKVYEDVDIVGR